VQRFVLVSIHRPHTHISLPSFLRFTSRACGAERAAKVPEECEHLTAFSFEALCPSGDCPDPTARACHGRGPGVRALWRKRSAQSVTVGEIVRGHGAA